MKDTALHCEVRARSARPQQPQRQSPTSPINQKNVPSCVNMAAKAFLH